MYMYVSGKKTAARALFYDCMSGHVVINSKLLVHIAKKSEMLASSICGTYKSVHT